MGRELQTVQSTRKRGTDILQPLALTRIKASISSRQALHKDMASIKALRKAVSKATARNRATVTSAAGNIIKAHRRAVSRATARNRAPVASAAGNIIKALRRAVSKATARNMAPVISAAGNII